MNDEDIKGVKPILHEWPTAHGLIRIVRVPGATWPSCETLDVDAGQWRACHPMEFMLTEEIVDLKKEIAVLRDGIDDWHKEADDRAREIIQQDAEIAALQEFVRWHFMHYPQSWPGTDDLLKVVRRALEEKR